MELLADESCTGPVVQALRGAGHNVLAIGEVAKGISDETVIERAFQEDRVLITEDRDFGELVYARGFPSVGIMFLKFDRRARGLKPELRSRRWKRSVIVLPVVSQCLDLGACASPEDHPAGKSIRLT